MPDKSELRNRTALRNFAVTVLAGARKVAHHSKLGIIIIVATLLATSLLQRITAPWSAPAGLQAASSAVWCVCGCCNVVIVLALIGYVPGALAMQHDFARIGHVNAAGEPPYLMAKELLDDNRVRLTYWCKGLPLSCWQDGKKKIETALDMYVATISEGADRRTISLTCVPSDYAYQYAPWDDRYTHRDDDAIIVLGMGLTGLVTIDINTVPHLLIAGGTGSGKTVLLQGCMWQAILQGDVVYIADFKGGVDFGQKWRSHAHLVTREKDLVDLLDKLAAELQQRKDVYTDVDAANITDYRAKTGEYMQRIVVACDEVAELLDKTGADKTRRDLIDQIAARLSLIARQGRAFGIHLWLATQRPDANILPGQIKNNIGCRICGRADATLSTIILGDGKADEEIPKDSKGRFVTDDGTVFQAFYIDEA